MPRPTRIYINLKAMRQNLRYAIEASRKAKVMAVVKANAYGHGLFRILQKFEGTSHHAKMSTTHANRLKSLIQAEDFTARDLEAMIDLLADSKFLEADQCSVMDALATNSTTTTSPTHYPHFV